MDEATGQTAPAEPRPDLQALLEEVDDAAYWSEHLVLTADVVSHGVLDCPVPARAMSDGIALGFLLEEAKCSTSRLRDAVDKLADHLGVKL
jgi:hypothetical protein